MKTRLIGNVHLIAGNAETISRVLLLLKDEGVETEANPDIYIRKYRYFSVDDARELRERASLRPMGGRRVFIIVAPDMNHNAQNALLKTLEEPPADATFFFIIPAPEMLLLTLRSRAQILTLAHTGEKADVVDAQAFLSAAPQKRLDMLKSLLEKDEDDKRDIGSIIGFLSSVERLLKRNPDGLHAIYRARKYIGDKGALVKPLLEQVALLVPKI